MEEFGLGYFIQAPEPQTGDDGLVNQHNNPRPMVKARGLIRCNFAANASAAREIQMTR